MGRITSNDVFQIIDIVCGAITLICLIVLLYKNISFVIMQRLFKEPNVIIIMILSLCNWAIDIGRPWSSFSSVNGFMYMVCVNAFVLLDAVIIKSRYLMIGLVLYFVALNVYNLYTRTIGDANNGVVLVRYNMQGNEYTIMKRSTQRSIFLQVLLFSANGIYTTFVDKTMKLMVFATGNIYKSTGTTSEEIEDTEFSLEAKREHIERI